MTYYIKSGNQFDVTSEANLDIHKLLPVATYTIQQRPMGGPLFFQQVDDLENKGKVYGDHKTNALRIINTYKDRPRNTGVLLTGEKGSGKTLLARMISEECAKIDMPTIIITKPWTGDAFETLINGITQDCVILFDEFEKVYDKDSQEAMLTLLDGLSASKKLFIFTANDKWKLDQFLHNRPGRIFYMIEYKGLTEQFIREYCQDILLNKDHIEKVVMVASMFTNFNFDMLKALVEEMNRYNEAPEEALAILNAKPESGRNANAEYTMTVIDKNSPNLVYYREDPEDNEWCGDIFNCHARIYYYANERHKKIHDGEIELPEDSTEKAELINVELHKGDLVSFNKKGEYIFETKNSQDNKVIVVLKKKETKQVNFYDFISD